jgi:hypothetical protein
MYFILQYLQYEGIWRYGDTAPLVLNIGTRWTKVVSFTFRLLYSRTSPVPNKGSLGGLQSWSERSVEQLSLLL